MGPNDVRIKDIRAANPEPKIAHILVFYIDKKAEKAYVLNLAVFGPVRLFDLAQKAKNWALASSIKVSASTFSNKIGILLGFEGILAFFRGI